MQGIVFTGERCLELMNFPDPIPGPGEVVLEMKASGMCGSRNARCSAPRSVVSTKLSAPAIVDAKIRSRISGNGYKTLACCRGSDSAAK